MKEDGHLEYYSSKLSKAWDKFKAKEMATRSAALAYVTILGIIPFFILLVSVVTYLDQYMQGTEEFKDFLINQMFPVQSENFKKYLHEFIINSGRISIIGFIFAFFSSFSLFINLNNSVNIIWGIKKKRRIFITFLYFISVTMLSPFLFALLFIFNKKVLVYIYNFAGETISSLEYFLFPQVVLFLIFFCFHYFFPYTRVSWKSAGAGSIFLMLTIPLLKWFFTLFVGLAVSIHTIYGSLSSIPLIFIWININWSLVLFSTLFVSVLNKKFIKEK